MNVLLLEQSHIIGKRILNMLAEEEKLKVTWIPAEGGEDFSIIDKYYTNILILTIDFYTQKCLKRLGEAIGKHKDLTIIALSNTSFRHPKEKVNKLGIQYYLDKSTDFFRLADICHTILNAN